MASASKQNKTNKNTNKEAFIWTDDEVQLLLTVTNEYKVAKSFESIDWESIQSKYGDILERFKLQYPDTERNSCGKDFPHNVSEIKKQVVATKLKNIRGKYRQSVDSGKRSGHGQVVWLYFDLCESIWGGSPATTSIDAGIESSDISSNATLSSASTTPSRNEDSDTEDGIPNLDPASESQSDPSTPVTPISTRPNSTSDTPNMVNRRALIYDKLKYHKQDKLKRKLSIDNQLLACAQEDSQVKKQLLEKLDNMDKKCTENMERMSSNVEKLTNCITQFFTAYQNRMPNLQQQPPMPPAALYHHQPIEPACYSPTVVRQYSQYPPINPTNQHAHNYNSTQFTFLDNEDK